MLTNLSQQQLNEFIQSPNPTILQLQLISQSNKQDQELSYACYLAGIKKNFRTIGLSAKQFVKVEKLLEQSDSKRTDVRRIHIKYTKDQPLGYKLEKLAAQVSSINSNKISQDFELSYIDVEERQERQDHNGFMNKLE